ncbi:hypothetical protein [Massilia sp. PWRC2]|uniref:FAD-dependent oxidoreductase n=1 Tax=Massilia sp. PWRC2 TaxID=2804626 RepID=UPI003CF4BCF3
MPTTNTNAAGLSASGPFPRDAMPPLGGDTGADVCVVGASFIGLRTAFDLLQNGKSVVVIEGDAGLPAAATSSPLAYAIVGLGGRIHGATRALDIRADHHMQVVTTGQGAIVARVVVVATDQRRQARGNGDAAAPLAPGETPALRILTTPAPDSAALFKPPGGRRAA